MCGAVRLCAGRLCARRCGCERGGAVMCGAVACGGVNIRAFNTVLKLLKSIATQKSEGLMLLCFNGLFYNI